MRTGFAGLLRLEGPQGLPQLNDSDFSSCGIPQSAFPIDLFASNANILGLGEVTYEFINTTHLSFSSLFWEAQAEGEGAMRSHQRGRDGICCDQVSPSFEVFGCQLRALSHDSELPSLPSHRSTVHRSVNKPGECAAESGKEGKVQPGRQNPTGETPALSHHRVSYSQLLHASNSRTAWISWLTRVRGKKTEIGSSSSLCFN